MSLDIQFIIVFVQVQFPIVQFTETGRCQVCQPSPGRTPMFQLFQDDSQQLQEKFLQFQLCPDIPWDQSSQMEAQEQISETKVYPSKNMSLNSSNVIIESPLMSASITISCRSSLERLIPSLVSTNFISDVEIYPLPSCYRQLDLWRKK